MKRLFFIIVTVCISVVIHADIAPGMYEVKVNTSLNVRDAPQGRKISTLNNGDVVQVLNSENGWAKVFMKQRIGYVNENYLLKLDYTAHANEEEPIVKKLNKLRHYAPFAVLFFVALAFVGMLTESSVLFNLAIFLWGVAELFLFGAGNESSVIWFCNPSDVGWLLSIINYIISLAVVIFQFSIYREFIRNFSFWKSLFFSIFMIAGAIIFISIFHVSYLFVFAFLIHIVILLYVCNSKSILVTIPFAALTFGLVFSFLGMLGTFILGALIWIGVLAFANSGNNKERFELDDGTIVEGSGTTYHDIRSNYRYRRDLSTGKFYRDD